MLPFPRKSKQVRERVAALRERLFRTAYAWCHNREIAQDLTQEAMLKAIEKAAQLKDPGAIDAWIFSILVNCHRSHLRRKLAVEEYADDSEFAIDDGLSPEQASEIEGLVAQVQRAISSLGMKQRQVLILVDIEEFSYTEVASILDVPIGTVMSRLNRARRQLKQRLLGPPERAPAVVSYLRRKN